MGQTTSKKNEEVLHTVVSGVCCAVNSALLFVTVITFPEGVPAVALMGGALALVSFGNSVSATLDDFVENSVVITQCLNAGEIGQYSSGGLVGQLQQSCLISDCINMGRSNKRANAIIGVECRGELASFRTSRIRFLFWELLYAGHCRATESCDYEHILLTRLKVGKDLYWMGL